MKKDFLKYSQQIKHGFQKNHKELLTYFESDTIECPYQFLKRRALSIELKTDKVYLLISKDLKNNQPRTCKLEGNGYKRVPVPGKFERMILFLKSSKNKPCTAVGLNNLLFKEHQSTNL